MNEEERKKIDSYADQSQRPQRPRLVWDSSQAKEFLPDVAQVKATKEEVWLLLGKNRKEQANPKDPLPESAVRIIMSPYTARQLSLALNSVIRKYETAFGPIEEKSSARPLQGPGQSPFRLPPFKSEKARERVGFLFQLLKDVTLRAGLERSFKVSEKTLLPNRFLLGFLPDSICPNPYEKILDVCKRMRMPEKFLNALEQNLPEATMVGLGIEEDESACVVKAYVEFKEAYEEALKKGATPSDSYVSHWGYKWDAEDNTKGALAKYTCFPALKAGEILERISENFYRAGERSPWKIVKKIVDLGSQKVGPDKFLYLEVNEESNPRSSFDINLYGANLRLEELHPYFLEMCRHFSIPAEQFRSIYEPVRTRTFGHLAGGLDRKGRDFLTIYFGE